MCGQIYYFRMWMTLIISGVCHGFLLLPVLLTWAGGPGYTIEDADEEWLIKVTRRHDYEIR
jgi:Niemann-Pick C1 protein